MNSQTRSVQLAARLALMGIFVVLIALIVLVTRGTATAVSPQAVSDDGLWQEVDETNIALQGERWIVPQQYRTLALNLADLQMVLAQAVAETAVVITLPLPDGTYGRFQVTESHVMHPQLADKFPEIKTYAGVGLDDAWATVRLDVTPAGFHAMILSAEETVYIDPYSRHDTTHYISYLRHDFVNPHEGFIQYEPLGDPAEIEALVEELQAGGGNIPSGDELRNYRLVVAATGEYTQYHGGTVGDGMAAIVTAVNRVVGIYIRDTAVNMQLVANNDLVVYTDPNTDPYTNNNGVTMLGQNQANLDAVIGNANYDIGHVFSTGGGGVANLGVPCRTGLKARGVTGLSNPIGDPFYVDYVAHEMGHQYGANHTFNGNAGSCAGGQWNGATAYEPGSGTTIMAYAGICSPQNIQLNSDDHFHTGSIDEIRAYTVVGLGNSCPVITNTANLPPVVNAGLDYNIPINTPFVLTGSATDPNGNPLTYNWEQFDTGPTGHPNFPVGNAPLFRSFSSVLTPTRTFPQISDIVNNTQTLGEILPSYGRNMRFHFTVRDNQLVAGGVDMDEMMIAVDGASGPFLVTAPNTAVTWNIGHTEAVIWDVANTDQAPINCTEVDILLSLDGGYTYPMLLEANRPNDGSENIMVPDVTTSLARVKVQCSDNIFFDISNTNFTIELGPTQFNVGKSVSSTVALPGDPLQYTIVVSNTGMSGTAVITDVFDVALLNTSCNGVPGDLSDIQPLDLLQQVTYNCSAQIEPTLAIEMNKVVDQDMVVAGTAVTYTITVTNPQNAMTLTNVIVDDPQAANCLPNLGTPITLGPSASQTYVCPDNIITQAVTNTATVSSTYEIVNIAGAFILGDVGSLQTSNPVVTAVYLEDSAVAAVQVIIGPTHFNVSKSVSSTVALPGDSLQYTIVVSNTGLSGTAVITDVFDAALINTSCNGLPGDLSDTQMLDYLAQITYSCSAQIDPNLAIEMSKVADQDMVVAGTAVTYTITVTNPHSNITLTNVIVDDPMAANCLPALNTPITLGPSASQTYVCANNIVTQTVTNIATVTGVYEIVNMAAAFVQGDMGSIELSNAVATAVDLENSAMVVVEVIEQTNLVIYLPFIMK